MSQEMMDKTCREFAEALAAREPVPGGGSASAFVGALGASLCGMVARYGATNPALADLADDLTRAFAQADELAQELVGLVAEDVRAYGQVSAAYGMRCMWPLCRRIALWMPAGVRWRCSRTWPTRVRVNCCPMWRAAPCSAVPLCRARA